MTNGTKTAVATAIGAILMGGAIALPKEDAPAKDDAFEQVRDEYYALPKVIPGTGGKQVYEGYDGVVARWNGSKEVWPDELPAKYRAKGGKKSEPDVDPLLRNL